MNAKPGWPVFATVLCFTVVGVLTLNSYQYRLNQSRVAYRTEISDATDLVVSAPDIVMLADATSDDKQSSIADEQKEPVAIADEHSQLAVTRPVYEAVECDADCCGTEALLDGTGSINDVLIEQNRIAKSEPGMNDAAQNQIANKIDQGFRIDPKAVRAMNAFASNIARTAMSRGGFGFPAEVVAEETAKSAKKTTAKEAKKSAKTVKPAKLASFRVKNRNVKPQRPTFDWNASLAKVTKMQESAKAEFIRFGSQLKAQYEWEQFKSSLRKISAQIDVSWFNDFIREVVAPAPKYDNVIDLNINTYAGQQNESNIALVNYIIVINDEEPAGEQQVDTLEIEIPDSDANDFTSDADSEVAGIEVDFGGDSIDSENGDDSDKHVSVFDLEFGGEDGDMVPELEDFSDIDPDSEINVAVSDSDNSESDDRRLGKIRERLQKVRSRIESRREGSRRIEGRRAEFRRAETR